MAKEIGTKKIDGMEKVIYEGGKTGRKLTVWTREVGQKFACCGIVKHGSKVIAETRDYPYGMTGPAYAAAEELIEQL